MKAWATAKSVRESVADVPKGWLVRFAANHPDAVRKLGKSKNATLLFDTERVVQAIREGEK